ncbi:MAG: MFS transporter [Spirochaetes bacterium]|nr:MFS transporter [Spirochaetota bacterium]MBU0956541.1 MFS transporter [Spirochaetota bacterium]
MNAPEKRNVRTLLGHRPYLYSLIGNTVSRIGDSIDTVAYSWLIYQLTGSLIMMGTIFAVSALPNILFGFLAGVLIDRLPKKPPIILGHLLRGTLVAAIAVLYLSGHLKIWMIYLFAFLQSTVEAFVHPAASGFFQKIVPKDLYLPASSFSQSAASLAELAGMGLAGLVIATLGTGGAILIDAATFFFAAGMVLLVKVDEPSLRQLRSDNGDDKNLTTTTKQFFRELKEGLVYVWSHKLIRLTIIMAALTNFALAPFGSLQAAYVKDVLGWGPAGLSVLGIIFPLGIMLGSLALSVWGQKHNRLALILTGFFLIGALSAGLALPVFGTTALIRMIMAGVLLFFFAATLPLVNATISAYIMENIPENYIGRSSSVMSVVCTSMLPLGAALSGIIAEATSLPLLYALMGGLILLVTAIVLALPFVKAELKIRPAPAAEQVPAAEAGVV